jgi:hypothetical protein
LADVYKNSVLVFRVSLIKLQGLPLGTGRPVKSFQGQGNENFVLAVLIRRRVLAYDNVGFYQVVKINYFLNDFFLAPPVQCFFF